MRNVAGISFGVATALGVLIVGRAQDQAREKSPKEIFERRIMPIFRSPNPSSCTECHLAGVELKNYILPSHDKTFVSLRDQGLINLDAPEESKILRFIKMASTPPAPGTALISQKVRQQEFEAFAEWIKASCADKALRDAPPLKVSDLAQPKRPPEVIRHARADRLLESFEKNVWSQRERCLYCHSAQGGGNAQVVAENGPEITWMKAEGAEATMRYLISDRRLVDPQVPEKSLLLRKPTNQVKHGGGQKILVGDMAYKAFRTWIEDYVNTVGDKYARARDLPKETAAAPALFGTKIRLKIANTPPAWGDRMLQVNVHAWDARKKAWEAEPIATSDRAVWAKGGLWAHELWLTAASDSERAKAWRSGRPSLPSGRYLIKVFVDLQGKLQRDWKALLGKADFVGEAEITTNWPDGKETSIESSQLRR